MSAFSEITDISDMPKISNYHENLDNLFPPEVEFSNDYIPLNELSVDMEDSKLKDELLLASEKWESEGAR